MPILVALLAVLAGGAFQQGGSSPGGDAQSALDGLAFMRGCWRGPLGNGEGDFVEERYGPPAGGLMLGTVKYVRAGRPTQHEFIEIRETDEGLSFLAYPGGRRSEHAFVMTSGDGAHAVFEAPEHDFPKRISYRLVGSDGLEGAVDGGADDPSPRRWPMRRVACDGPEVLGQTSGSNGVSAVESAGAPVGDPEEFRRHLAWPARDGTSWLTVTP